MRPKHVPNKEVRIISIKPASSEELEETQVQPKKVPTKFEIFGQSSKFMFPSSDDTAVKRLIKCDEMTEKRNKTSKRKKNLGKVTEMESYQNVMVSDLHILHYEHK